MYIIIFILTVGLLGKVFSKSNMSSQNKSFAISEYDGWRIMGKNDPFKKEINKTILKEDFRKAEVERVKKEEDERKKEEAKRAEDKKNSKKVAYLTFDDGPSVKSTPIILDVLKKYDIKGTFFVLGKMVEQNPKILKRVYDEGHQIGNHSYSHNYNYLYKDSENFMEEIYKTENLIKSAVEKNLIQRL